MIAVGYSPLTCTHTHTHTQIHIDVAAKTQQSKQSSNVEAIMQRSRLVAQGYGKGMGH